MWITFLFSNQKKRKVHPPANSINQKINHAGERAFIVTQSIKKLNKDDKKWALDKTGFKRVEDDTPISLSEIPEDDNGLYYKDEPYTPNTLHQRLIVTYSPKYARYQKAIRDAQVDRAEKMLNSGKVKKERRNPNDPARFIGKIAVTEDSEAAKSKIIWIQIKWQMKHFMMECMR